MSAYKVAGQASPAANTFAELYKVPVGKQFVSSSLIVCNGNTSGAIVAVDIAVIPSGESLTSKNYIFRNKPIDQRDTKAFVVGITLSPGDTISVKSTDGSTSFSLFGNEF